MSDIKKRLLVCTCFLGMFLLTLLGCYATYGSLYLYFDVEDVFKTGLKAITSISAVSFLLGLILSRNIGSKAFLIIGNVLSSFFTGALCMCALCWIGCPMNSLLSFTISLLCTMFGFVMLLCVCYLLVDYFSYLNWTCGIASVLLMLLYVLICDGFCEANHLRNPLELFFSYPMYIFSYLFVYTIGYTLGTIECGPDDLNLTLYNVGSIYFGFLFILSVILVKVLKIGTKTAIYINSISSEIGEEFGLSDDFADSGYSYDND